MRHRTTVTMVAHRVPQMSRPGRGRSAANMTGCGYGLCRLFFCTVLLLHLNNAWGGTPALPHSSSPANASALLQAAASGRLDEVKALLELGVDANATSTDKNARSALIIAAAAGHLETVRVLLDAGANMESADSAGLTALNWAALRGRNQVAELLLEGGAYVNTTDNNGVSPLLYAVGTRNIGLLRLLMARGADPDVISEANRMTPLLVAVENDDSTVAVLLLDHGANVNGANQLGHSALMAAAESGRLEMVTLLMSRGADAGP